MAGVGDAAGGLSELKQVLRSLVVSSPTQVDVRSLLRDYRALVGQPLPLRRYGYTEPDTFLREQCSDCFLFQGGVNPVLTLIVPKQLKHIDAHVQRQKISSTSKFKGKRRSIPETAIRTPVKRQEPPTNNIVQSFLEKKSNSPKPQTKICEDNNKRAVTPECDKSASTHYNDKENVTVNINNSSGTDSSHRYIKQKKFISEHIHKNLKSEERSNKNINSCTEWKKDEYPKNLKSEERSNKNINPCTELKKDEYPSESGSGSRSSSLSSARQQELEQLKRDVRDIIADSPDGVSLTDLMKLYRERYGRELSFSRVGLSSVLSVVGALGPGVVVTGGPGGWRAALKQDPPTRGPTPTAQDSPTHRTPSARTHLALRPTPSSPRPRDDDDDALPGIDFEPDVFPVDCLHYLESIERASLDDWTPGAMLPVIVGEVYSPSHFWLLRLGEEHYAALDALMDDMNVYYGSAEGAGRRLAVGAVRVGHHCAALYEGDWHRALIVRTLDHDTVKVRHVDWGTVERASARELRPLGRRWGGLAAQAVRARLAHVRPPARARRWPLAACDTFLRIVRDTRLVAEVVAVDHEEEVVEVALVDTSTDEDVCVATELVRAGYADARDDSALRTGECYLHPSFEALESGATPNYAEIHGYLRDGIALEFVEDFRRHVPTALPPAEPRPPPAPSVPLMSPPAAPPSPKPAPTLTPPPTPPATPSPPPRAPSLPAGLELLNRVPLSPPVAVRPTGCKPQHEVAPVRVCAMPPPRFGPPPPPPGFTGPPGFAPPPPYFEPMMYPMFPPYSFGPHPPPFMMGPPPMPMCPPPMPRVPRPPAPTTGEAASSVKLSASECEMFRLLSAVDANAAHCYMMEAISRAMAALPGPGPALRPRSALNPAAAEFRLPSSRP